MSIQKIVRASASIAIMLTCAGAASAAVIDGTLDGSYGPALAVQNTATSFGSNSSLCAAYAENSGGNWNFMFTGKLNTGFERLVVLFDTAAGGQNVLNGVTGANINGMTLDAGFDADYSVVINGDGGAFYVDYGVLGVSGQYAGSGPNAGGALSGGAGAPANTILAARNNAGPGLGFGFGLLGAGDLAVAAGYTTGLEFGIPSAVIGSPVVPFKVMAFILGGDGSTRSTQFLGGINAGIADGDYSSASGLNLSQISGNQFFTVPAPGSAALLGLGGLLAARRRR